MPSRLLNLFPARPDHPGFAALRRASQAEQFRFLQRLEEDWDSGANRFDDEGECLLGAVAGENLRALGGLNRDPYAQESGVGRLRHVYVAPGARRLGLGRLLVERLLEAARGDFHLIRLRAPLGDARAAAFYEALGFRRVAEPQASHLLRL